MTSINFAEVCETLARNGGLIRFDKKKKKSYKFFIQLKK